jgi:xanthine dehydrogenase small subunit
VVVADLDGDGGEVRTRTVNACLQFVPVLDGKALFTVESLRRPDGRLHPAQEAMVACHGSQCGFCTPGFVMSLWGLYVDHAPGAELPDDKAVRTALTGNLCRCTGYKPIIEAGRRMFELPAAPLDREALRLQLLGIRRDETLVYSAAGRRFYAPRALAELVALRAEHPQATLLAGNTDVGLWVNKQLRDLGDILYTGEVAELKAISHYVHAVRIGAAVTLEDAFAALAHPYPELADMWERFASPPIRNAGTLGGNVANGSPIGDSMPALIALGATVVLRSPRGRGRRDPSSATRRVLLPTSSWAVEVPLPARTALPDSRSLPLRLDISAVRGLRVRLDGDTITRCVAFGGMAPRRSARQAERR